MQKLFHKENQVCIIEYDENEPMEFVNERGYFVINQKPETQEEYNKAILYSNIFINVKFRGCEYNDKVMAILKSMMN